jgi:uncharacterized protein (DUF2062 family)
VGRGTALGVFIGVLPTLWFGPLLAVFAAGPLGANRAAALASMVATGPLMPFIWTLCVVVGNQLVSERWRVAADLIASSNKAEITQRFFATFLVGNVAVGAALALAGYVLVWWLAHRHRSRKRKAAQVRLEPQMNIDEH